MCEENGGAEKLYFYAQAVKFVKHISDFTGGGFKVHFVYDGYRAHMSLRVIHQFESNSIIAYALTATERRSSKRKHEI